MIFLFEIMKRAFFVGVGKRRELSIAAPTTKYVFITIDDLSKLKRFTSQDLNALVETKNIVKSLKSDLDVKDYVITEIEKIGGVFKRMVTLDEYKEFVGEV